MYLKQEIKIASQGFCQSPSVNRFADKDLAIKTGRNNIYNKALLMWSYIKECTVCIVLQMLMYLKKYS